MDTTINQEPWYIQESKMKCVQLGMDPQKLPSFSNVLTERVLNMKRIEYKEILSVVNFFVQKTLDHLQGYPILIVITDENAAILEMSGDETIKNMINQLGIKPGLQFEEDITGTNSITLALKYRHPVQLIGKNHFHEFLHHSACYTVPFRYSNTKLIGTISIMTGLELHHPTLPAMLNTVAETIERELMLRLQNRKLHIMNQIMIDSTQNGIIVTDKEGMVTEFNQFAQDFMGIKKKDVLLKPVQYIETFGQYINEITKNGQKKENLEILYEGPKFPGQKKVCLFDSLPIYDENSLLIGAYGQFRDITESYEAKEHAEKASKAKTDFLSSMSHELRTPLNAILGFAQLLEYDSLSPSQLEDIREIIKAGNHLLDLINEILDLARIESNRIELAIKPMSLNSLIQECVTLVETIANTKSVNIIWKNKPKDIIVNADRVRLKQALINLMSNAIKYNVDDGSVVITTETTIKGRVKIKVMDTGSGIPTENIAFIFQPFNRLVQHSSIEGTGIGLTITKQIVELMGGSISVHSEIGIGTVFSIELGMVAGLEEPLCDEILFEEEIVELPKINDNTKTILYIEDNLANQKIIARIFRGVENIQLLTAMTAEEGIKLAEAHLPDVILLDIHLPDMNGFEAFKRMQSIISLRNIPVIGLSANAMATDIKRGIDLGFKRYITKPIQVSTFIESVNQVLQTNHALEEFRSDVYKYSLGGI